MSIFSRESRYNCIVCMKILDDGTAVKNFVANYLYWILMRFVASKLGYTILSNIGSYCDRED